MNWIETASAEDVYATEQAGELDLAKQNTAAATPDTSPTGRTQLPLTVITGGSDWRDTPLLKSRMAGGFCLRAPAQGACSYANICEHCPSYRSEPSSLPILAAQRVDTEARDAWLACMGATQSQTLSGGIIYSPIFPPFADSGEERWNF